MTKHLVIGSNGLVGRYLVYVLQSMGENVLGLTRQDWLIENIPPRKLHSLKPDIVYLAAALTNVDACEAHHGDSARVNVFGTANVARLTELAWRAKLVYFSTDYVFDGREGPYVETDKTNPINQYGRDKETGETLVEFYLPKSHLIVRTTNIYGVEPQRKNFACQVLGALHEGRSIKAVGDQVSTPTYALDLAVATVKLAQLDTYGIYHVAGKLLASRAFFARALAKQFGYDTGKIATVGTKDIKQRATRPKLGGLICQKAEDLLGYEIPSFENALPRFVKEFTG